MHLSKVQGPSAFVSLVLVVACGGAVSAGESSDTTESLASALDVENGGLSTENEAPAFGDGNVSGAAGVDPHSGEAAPPKEPEGATIYHVALLWGNLPAPRDTKEEPPVPPTEWVDWTGAVSVASGAIGLQKTVLFEPHDALAKRESESRIAFSSKTLPSVDGLILRVAIPKDGAHELRFESNALTYTLDLAALAVSGKHVERLADGKNGLFATGYAATSCPRGIVMGHWDKHKAKLGTMKGHVLGAQGVPVGHMKGLWGHSDKKDASVFFAKYIDHKGTHEGLVRGTYGAGRFEGSWRFDKAHGGRIDGIYTDGMAPPPKREGDQPKAPRPMEGSAPDAGKPNAQPPPGDGGPRPMEGPRGFFLGRWIDACGEKPTDEAPASQ